MQLSRSFCTPETRCPQKGKQNCGHQKDVAPGVPDAHNSCPLKLCSCLGCGERLPRRDLVELHQDKHDDLTYFHDDLLCWECDNVAGVIL
jgi:hypothetical protein